MADEKDLAPAEARAEIEAFMGEGWVCETCELRGGEIEIMAGMRNGIALHFFAPTYRAAVDALKQAWRDAVRPWMERAIEAKLDTADVDGYAPDERVIARVCEEGMRHD